MLILPVSCKLCPTMVNSMAGRQLIIKWLDESIGHCYDIVDADMKYWQNDEMTLVIRIKVVENKNDIIKSLLGLSTFMMDSSADEFHYELPNDDMIIIRFWWD
jgi:hypothetical protein